MAKLLELDSLDDADLAAWRALAAAAVEPNPFFEPAFVLPAARALDGGADVRLAVVRQGDRWLAAAPVRIGRWKGLPLRAAATWTNEYCFLGAPLLASEEALGALVAELRRHAAMVVLEQLPDGMRLDGARVFYAWERAALYRRPENDYIASMLSPKRRRELRRQRRLLDEQAPVTFAVAAGEPEMVEAFLALEASGWKGKAGTAMTSAGHASFMRAVCESFAAAGRLQLLALRSGDQLVAAQCNLLAGDGVFCFKLGVDEAFGRFSPGVLLQEDNVDLFHRTPGLEWEDSCADPQNQMINRLWPDRRRLTTLLVPGRGARGVAGRAQVAAAVSLRERRKEPS